MEDIKDLALELGRSGVILVFLLVLVSSLKVV